jgi:Cytosol aminopeptidase family, N-terminal domain
MEVRERILVGLIAFFAVVTFSRSSPLPAGVQSAPATAATKPEEFAIRDGPIPMRVLVESPAETDAELQVICLFRSDPTNALHGSLVETNQKLKGMLDQIRQPTLFRGELGETLLIHPTDASLRAKQVLIIGLGDSSAFVPERMELVGSILYREASRLGIQHPFFAPTVIDGGVTKYTTGQVSEQVLRGFFRAARAERILASAGESPGSPIQDLTYLAGPAHATETKDGMEKAIAGESGR